MRTNGWMWGCALLVAGCGAVEPQDADGWDVDDSYEVTEPVDATPVQESDSTTEPGTPTEPYQPITEAYDCGVEAASQYVDYWVNPGTPRFSPNEQLFIVSDEYQQLNAMSVTNGELFTAVNLIGFLGVDDDWKTVVLGGPYGQSAIRDLETGRDLATFDSILSGAVAPGGDAAAVVSCDVQETELIVFDVGTETSERIPIDGESCYTYGYNQQQALTFAGADDDIIVGTVKPGEVFTYVRSTGELTKRAVVERTDQDYQTQLSGFGVDSKTNRVFTVTHEGQMQGWSLPELQSTGEPQTVGAFSINEYSYAPQFIVSPVAFSPDGQAMAFVNDEGDVVVRTSGGDAVLPSPERAEEPEEWDSRDNVPVRIAFSPTGKRIGVSYQFGTTVWNCGAPAPTATSGISVDAPDEVVVPSGSYTVEIPFAVDGAGPFASVRVETLDGLTYGSGLDGDKLIVWISDREDRDLIVRVTDGTTELTHRLHVDFLD